MHPLWYPTLIIICTYLLIKLIKLLIVKIRRSKIKLIKNDKTNTHIENMWNEVNN